ncbi:hypothetical protein ABEB36_006356 [Hypothenemus hampei]
MTVLSYITEILIILTVILLKFLWGRNRKFEWANDIPGPKTLPVIGNALTLYCRDYEIFFQNLMQCCQNFPSPMKLSTGLKLYVIFSDPFQVEKIFTSNALLNKDDLYKYIEVFYGESLITGSGSKWKKDRRLLSPLFLIKNIKQYFPAMLKHSEILVDILQTHEDGLSFNVERFLHRAVTDIVNETIIGFKANCQRTNELDSFIHHITRAYNLVHQRMIKPWLQIEFLYKLSKNYRQQMEAKDVIYNFFRKSLEHAKEQHVHQGNGEAVRSMLDQMLDIRDEVPHFASDEEILHHLITLFSAGEDTITLITSFTLVMLGLHPECQNKVAQELHSVLGDDNLQEFHLSKLTYLEMVIKETMRLFPIAPLVLRQASQDTELESWKIPQGTTVSVNIFHIHRDKRHWLKPQEFYPEHFLPEAVSKRHPYAYLPFSAGSRGCLGKRYAYMAMEVILATILRRYSVKTEGSLNNLELSADLSVRLKGNNYSIKISKRVF